MSFHSLWNFKQKPSWLGKEWFWKLRQKSIFFPSHFMNCCNQHLFFFFFFGCSSYWKGSSLLSIHLRNQSLLSSRLVDSQAKSSVKLVHNWRKIQHQHEVMQPQVNLELSSLIPLFILITIMLHIIWEQEIRLRQWNKSLHPTWHGIADCDKTHLVPLRWWIHFLGQVMLKYTFWHQHH